MENTDIVLLKSGISSDVNILKPEEQEDILGGATKCDQGYRHGLFYGTKCDCGYDNGHIDHPTTNNTQSSSIQAQS